MELWCSFSDSGLVGYQLVGTLWWQKIQTGSAILAAARSVADVGLSFTWESCYTIRTVKYSLMIVNGTIGPVQMFSAACLAGRQ